MAKLVPKLEDAQNYANESELSDGLDHVLKIYIDKMKNANAQHIKASEVEQSFKPFLNFPKEAQVSNLKKHTFFFLKRQVYGQKRSLVNVKNIINKTGRFFGRKLHHDQIDVWSYDIKNTYANKKERYDLEGTEDAYHCPKCAGRGIDACLACNGSGLYQGSAGGACVTCNGSGKDTCLTCEGHRSMYDIIQLEVNHIIDEYTEFITNLDYTSVERQLFNNENLGKEFYRGISAFDIPLSEGEKRFIDPEEIPNEHIEFKEFFQNASAHFLNKTSTKYLHDHSCFCNQLEFHTCDVTYNGQTKSIAIGKGENGRIVFEPHKLDSFFSAANKNLKQESEKRAKKKKVMAVAAIVIAGYIISGSLTYFNKQNAIEENAKAAKLQQEKGAFKNEMAKVTAYLEERNYKEAYSVLKSTKEKYGKYMSKKQSTLLGALNNINTLTYKDLTNKNVEAWRMKEIATNYPKSSNWYYLCKNFTGCGSNDIPKHVQMALQEKIGKLMQKNYRDIASNK